MHPTTLQAAHQLHSSIDLNDPKEFFKAALSKLNLVTMFYLLVLGYFVGAYVAVTFNGTEGLPLYLGTLAIFPATLLLLPVHEALHALAYWLCGARDIRFGFVRQQLMVYAGAHLFVANTRQFLFVALLPFLVITAALLGVVLLLPAYALFAYGVLMLHTFCCMGDMALLSYYYTHRQRGLLTYDDLDDKKMHFYRTR